MGGGGVDAAQVVSHCCNHFRRQVVTKTVAVAAKVTVQLQVGDGVEKPSDSVFSPEGGEGEVMRLRGGDGGFSVVNGVH